MKIKISVIIPVYNMARYLPECLDSIVRQTLNDIEIIAVNDGSVDDSLLILKQYANEYKIITILSQQNQGAGVARNNGIRHARGKYIAVMDPDDYYPQNDCLEVLYNAAEEHNVLICGGIIMGNYNGERHLWDKTETRAFYCNKLIDVNDYLEIYGHQRYIYNTDLIKENNIFYLTCRRYEDQVFALNALVCAKKFYGVNKVVYEYRRGYKKTKYTMEISRDILYGIKETLKIVRNNNLMLMYENRIRKIHLDYCIPFYKYSFCGNQEIDEKIEEINVLIRDWIGMEEPLVLSRERVKYMIAESWKEYKIIMNTLNSNRMKIIYGAGIIAHNFIEKNWDIMKNVIGVAVTQKENLTDNISGKILVKQIEEYLPYKDEVQVLIVTTPVYYLEIEQNLNRLEFKNIIKPDIKKIELAESLE